MFGALYLCVCRMCKTLAGPARGWGALKEVGRRWPVHHLGVRELGGGARHTGATGRVPVSWEGPCVAGLSEGTAWMGDICGLVIFSWVREFVSARVVCWLLFPRGKKMSLCVGPYSREGSVRACLPELVCYVRLSFRREVWMVCVSVFTELCFSEEEECVRIVFLRGGCVSRCISRIPSEARVESCFRERGVFVCERAPEGSRGTANWALASLPTRNHVKSHV